MNQEGSSMKKETKKEPKSLAIERFKTELNKSDEAGAIAAGDQELDLSEDGQSELAPLALAASMGRIQTMRALLDRGALIDERDARGMTALMRAAEAGQLEAARWLIGAGASAAWRDAEGRFLMDILEVTGQRKAWEDQYPKGKLIRPTDPKCDLLWKRELLIMEKHQLEAVRARKNRRPTEKAEDLEAAEKKLSKDLDESLKEIMEGWGPNDLIADESAGGAETKMGMPLLCRAIGGDDRELVAALIATGKVNPNFRIDDQAQATMSPLGVAIRSADAWALEAVLRIGASPMDKEPELGKDEQGGVTVRLSEKSWAETHKEMLQGSQFAAAALAKKYNWIPKKKEKTTQFAELAAKYGAQFQMEGLLPGRSAQRKMMAAKTEQGEKLLVEDPKAQRQESVEMAKAMERLIEDFRLVELFEKLSVNELAIDRLATSVADGMLQLERQESGWELRLPQWAARLAIDAEGSLRFVGDLSEASKIGNAYRKLAYGMIRDAKRAHQVKQIIKSEPEDQGAWDILSSSMTWGWREPAADKNTVSLLKPSESKEGWAMGAMAEAGKMFQGEPGGRAREMAARAMHAFASPRRGLPDLIGKEVPESSEQAEQDRLRSAIEEKDRHALEGSASFAVEMRARSLGALRGERAQTLLDRMEECKGKIAQRAARIMRERAQAFQRAPEGERFARAMGAMARVWGKAASPVRLSKTMANLEVIEEVLKSRGAAGAMALRAAELLELEQIDADIVGRVKGELRKMGLGEAGWKKLIGCEEEVLDRIMAPVLRRGHHGRPVEESWAAGGEKSARVLFKMINAAASFGFEAGVVENLVAMVYPKKEADVQGRHARLDELGSLMAENPPARKVASVGEAQAFLKEAQDRNERLPHVIKAFLLRVGKIGVDRGLEELHLVVDCLNRIEMGVWGMMERKPTWNQLMAIQEEWHEQMTTANASPLKWEPLVEKVKGPEGLEATELVDGKALAIEGRDMHHCVSGYAGQCHAGKSRIYAVRRDGARLGTLELQRRAEETPDVDPGARNNAFGVTPKAMEGKWSAVQFRGLCNAKIEDEQAWAFAAEVARACNEQEARLKESEESTRKEAAGLVEKIASRREAGQGEPGAGPRRANEIG